MREQILEVSILSLLILNNKWETSRERRLRMSNNKKEIKDFDLKMNVYKHLNCLKDRQLEEVKEQNTFLNLIPDACADLKTLDKFIKDFDEKVNQAYADYQSHDIIDDLRKCLEMMKKSNLESESIH